MRKMKRILGVLICGLLALGQPAAASNLDTGFGARAMGLADAGSADAGSLGTMTLNPAAFGHLRRWQTEFHVRKLFHVPAGHVDLSGLALGLGMPVSGDRLQGAFGLHYAHDSNAQVGLDRTLGLSYGTRSWREIGAGLFDIGMTLKLISRSGKDYPGSIARAAVDIGGLFRWDDDKSVGLSVLNLTRPKTGLPGYDDRAPVMLKLGYAQRFSRFAFVTDLTQREPSAEFGATTTAGMGLEYSWATIRHGMFTARSGLSLGGDARSWTAGAGWKVLGARIDYALRVPLSGASKWSHGFSLSYLFGAWDTEAEYERLLRKEMSYRRDLTRALESAEIKQWKLAEDLRLMRDELSDLRREVAIKAAETGEAKDDLKQAETELRIKKLEEKRREAQKRLEAMREEQRRIREADKLGRFREDWRAYEDLKIQGVSEVVLIDRLKAMLRQYQDMGVDLGEANRELQRLLRR